MKLYESGEDYLEAVLMLQKKNGMVRSVDLARHMEVSKPSVCHAVATLRDGGGGHDSALRRGSARPGSHRDRLGGQRHGPPCARDVRFSGKHPDEGAHLVAERLGGGRDPAV